MVGQDLDKSLNIGRILKGLMATSYRHSGDSDIVKYDRGFLPGRLEYKIASLLVGF